MKTLLLLTISLTLFGCSKSSDCYLCEKDERLYRYCKGVAYSPTMTFDEQIEWLKSEGYKCDYYKD
jgi:hypothetical protein